MTPTPMILPAGTRIDNYRIERRLGRGGFGVTYLATEFSPRSDLDDDEPELRKVALKEYLPQQLARREADSRVVPNEDVEGSQATFTAGMRAFLKEARAIARLDHRHIVPIHRVFESNGTAYFSMPYFAGQSLAALLRQRRTLTAAEIERLLLPLLDALEKAHLHGVLHRDIKPDNVLLNAEQSEAVLIDFGAARVETVGGNAQYTQLHDLNAYSVPYAAIEQYSRATTANLHRPYTDIYAFCAMLYEVVTGEKPPESAVRNLELSPGRADPMLPVTLACPNPDAYPGSLLAAIQWGLELNGSDRPQSVAELRDCIRGLCAVPDKVTQQLATGPSVTRPTLISTPTHATSVHGSVVAPGKPTSSAAAPASTVATTEPPRRAWLKPAAALGIVLVLMAAGFGIAHLSGTGGMVGSRSEPALAVLPFTNSSGDPANEYFSDGLSEELINTLGRVKNLKVVGRTSSFQFRSTKDDARTIGKKLGVGYLVDGSVRKAADRVRIGVSLVHTADGTNLWSDSYDRELKDIFGVQTEIATAVSGELQRSLGISTKQASSAKPGDGWPPSGKVEAYEALLQGNFYSRRANAADEAKALEFFERAIALDPRYALAHAQLAISGMWYAGVYANPSPDERDATMTRARAAVATALQLEPDLARARFAQAQLHRIDLRLADAEREYQRAAELSPNDPAIIRELGLMQSERGHLGAALATIDRAAALDPLSRDALFSRGLMLDLTGRFDEAESALRKAIEVEPHSAATHAQLTITKVHQGDPASAVAIAREEPDPFWRQWALAMTLFAHGDRKQADAELDALIRDNADSAAFQIAEVYALRKDPDAVFRWLDHALATKDPGVNQLFTSSLIAAYRDDPRYAEVARKVGLDPADAPPLPKSAARAK